MICGPYKVIDTPILVDMRDKNALEKFHCLICFIMLVVVVVVIGGGGGGGQEEE